MKQQLYSFFISKKTFYMVYTNNQNKTSLKESVLIVDFNLEKNSFRAITKSNKKPLNFSIKNVKKTSLQLSEVKAYLQEIQTVINPTSSTRKPKLPTLFLADSQRDKFAKYFYQGLIYGESTKNKKILSSLTTKKVQTLLSSKNCQKLEIEQKIINTFKEKLINKNEITLNWFPKIYKRKSLNNDIISNTIPAKIFPLFVKLILFKNEAVPSQETTYSLKFLVNQDIYNLHLGVPHDLVVPLEDSLPVFDNEEVDTLLNTNIFTFEDRKTSFIDKYEIVLDYIGKLTDDILKTNISDIDYTLEDTMLVMIEDTIYTHYIRKQLRKIFNPQQNHEVIQNNFKLFDNFIGKNEYTPIIVNQSQKMKTIDTNHIAQINNVFPLQETQRLAIKSALSLNNDGDILAVNGPPGTGKSTILQSIIMSSWVMAAIKKSKPQLIVATAATNQAITNILDSFYLPNYEKLDDLSLDNLLKNRWLPKIDNFNTLGLYFKNSYNYYNKNEKYLLYSKVTHIDELFTPEYLSQAKQNIITYTNKSLQTCVFNISQAQQELHKQLLKNYTNIQKTKLIFDSREEYIEIILNNIEEFVSLQDNLLAIEKQLQTLMQMEDENNQCILSLQNAYHTYTKNLNFFCRIPLFNYFTKNERSNLARSILLDYQLPYKLTDFMNQSCMHSLDEIREDLLTQIAFKKNEYTNIQKQVQQITVKFEEDCQIIINSIDNLKAIFPIIEINNIKDFYQKLNIHSNHLTKPILLQQEQKLLQTVNNYLDIHVRYNMFTLAMHYWEANFIADIEIISTQKKRLSSTKEDYQLLAQLFPLFIATCHSGPRFFGNGDIIDTLIVDEAGQLASEIGSSMFSLAKNAIIVGDTKQIPPTWNVHKNIDQKMIDIYLNKSFDQHELKNFAWSLSAGSVMQIAQQRTYITRECHPNKEQGLLLQEHFRCYDEIINYCNNLVYHGELLPLKGSYLTNTNSQHNQKIVQLFGSPINHPLIAVNIPNGQTRQGASWCNEIEANYITKCILEIARLNPENEIHNIVSVITPFTAQARMIQRKVFSLGSPFKNIKIGTIHSLQGAENEIILFSSVYSDHHTKKCFFNENPNMLNVAVSRAKNAFITIGSVKLLTSNPSSYSKMLIEQSIIIET